MLSQERFSRREFNNKLLAVFGGGLALAAGCTNSDKTKQKTEIQPTKEPLQKWSRVVVPLNTGIYAPVKGLDSSQLGVTDLIAYSQPGDEIVWYAVVVQNFNPNLPDIEFYLAKYKETLH